MAILRHGNVKFKDSHTDQTHESDELMTLAHPKDPNKLPVYICAMPFLLEKEALREIIANCATLKPQPVSVFISEHTHAQQPDLMLSIQAYCVNNSDVIDLEVIDIVSTEQAFEPTEITLMFGSADSLQHCLQHLPSSNDNTVIYFPENIQDQLNLHRLLDLETEHAVIPVVNTESPSVFVDQPNGTAFIQAVDLAIAHDAQLFRWIEGHASQLFLQKPDAVAQLVMRFNTSASVNSSNLLDGEHATISLMSEITNNEISKADAMAILILIRVHISVLADLLPSGADARIWQLLSTLGHTLYFSELSEHATDISKHLFEQSSTALLTSIGALAAPQDVPLSFVEAAMLWLKAQNR